LPNRAAWTNRNDHGGRHPQSLRIFRFPERPPPLASVPVGCLQPPSYAHHLFVPFTGGPLNRVAAAAGCLPPAVRSRMVCWSCRRRPSERLPRWAPEVAPTQGLRALKGVTACAGRALEIVPAPTTRSAPWCSPPAGAVRPAPLFLSTAGPNVGLYPLAPFPHPCSARPGQSRCG